MTKTTQKYDYNFLTKIDDEEEESLLHYYYDEPGSSPGTVRFKHDATAPIILLIDYNSSNATKVKLSEPELMIEYLDKDSITWVDVLGLGNELTWNSLAEIFNLHPLIVEDVVNVPQRPKVEEYDNQLLIITQMIMPKENELGFYTEQVSFVLGENYLLTIQEEPERDSFTPVRDRIRNNKGVIRQKKADYLTYALLDAIIDGFFPVLELYGETIDQLEDEVVVKPNRKTLQKIYQIRRELLTVRRAIWPLRDAINTIIRDGHHLISNEVKIYLRDCYDHIVQVMDIIETYRDLSSGLMDIYLSSVGNKMNEVMKLLTVISSIFIPLTFIAGVYGMNFNTEKSPLNMPELSWYWGYPAFWLLMCIVSGGLVFFFWKRGWFENFSGIKSMDNEQ